MSSLRSKKIADLLCREISQVIQRRLKDPRVGFVTITKTSMSDDLKQATVYVSVLEHGKNTTEAIDALNHAALFIRAELKKQVYLKYTPYLNFKIDDTAQYIGNIEKLIDKAKENQS